MIEQPSDCHCSLCACCHAQESGIYSCLYSSRSGYNGDRVKARLKTSFVAFLRTSRSFNFCGIQSMLRNEDIVKPETVYFSVSKPHLNSIIQCYIYIYIYIYTSVCRAANAEFNLTSFISTSPQLPHHTTHALITPNPTTRDPLLCLRRDSMTDAVYCTVCYLALFS